MGDIDLKMRSVWDPAGTSYYHPFPPNSAGCCWAFGKSSKVPRRFSGVRLDIVSAFDGGIPHHSGVPFPL